MNTAEQLLSKKPINRQVAGPIVEDLSTRIKILENLMEEVKNKRQEFQTAFENFDQKVNQLFNMLSTVLKSMKEMEQAIIRNMR
jgi:predicted ribosome quality control (RQC) complex YloA/Tae2 family protein